MTGPYRKSAKPLLADKARGFLNDLWCEFNGAVAFWIAFAAFFLGLTAFEATECSNRSFDAGVCYDACRTVHATRVQWTGEECTCVTHSGSLLRFDSEWRMTPAPKVDQ